jgi:hypothetical protein
VNAETLEPAYAIHHRKPPTSGSTGISWFREVQVVNPSGVQEPTLVVLDLTEWVPTVPELVDLVVPLARDVRSGRLGPLALVICTVDRPTREVLSALAIADDLSLFVATAPDQLADAEPLGRLTETERRTVELMRRLGGRATASTFAAETGLALTAATNRLVGVARKGFLQKADQPRPAGSVYLEPRGAIAANARAEPVPEGVRREVELFAAVAGCAPEVMIAAAGAAYAEAHGSAAESPVAAWLAYREQHASELSERLRQAQEVLADPQRAAVDMSGMSDEDLAELRREFG